MELFKVSLINENEEQIWKLSRYLSDAFAELHSCSGAYDLQWDIDPSGGEITCLHAAALSPGSEERKTVLRRAAAGLAEYVLNEHETGLIRLLVRKESGYEDPEDLIKIERYCSQLLSGSDDALSPGLEQQEDKSRRKDLIGRELFDYLTENSGLNLSGFITFRLTDYWESLREIVEYAVDEFVMEKQYQDFIALLRYFVGLQDTKTPIVHLMQPDAGGPFQLCNHQFMPLEYRQSDRIVAEMLETEMNVEDRIVSSLIAASPKQIIIHTRCPEQQVIRTIESIFAGRVTVCSDCFSCNAWMKEHLQPKDQRYT